MSICEFNECTKPLKSGYKLCYTHFLKTHTNKCIKCDRSIISDFEVCYNCNTRKLQRTVCLF